MSQQPSTQQDREKVKARETRDEQRQLVRRGGPHRAAHPASDVSADSQMWSRREMMSLHRVLATFGPPPKRSDEAASADGVTHDWSDVILRGDLKFKSPQQLDVRARERERENFFLFAQCVSFQAYYIKFIDQVPAFFVCIVLG